MSDWERFVREVSWFVQPGESVSVGEAGAWTRGAVEGLPELSALLESATLTPVAVAGNDYELLAWGPAGDRRGWLCELPREAHGDTGGEALPGVAGGDALPGGDAISRMAGGEALPGVAGGDALPGGDAISRMAGGEALPGEAGGEALPGVAGGEAIPRVHKDFWRVCGGIVERFGEPSTWWLNQNQVLTVDAARVSLDDVLNDYGLPLPIEPDDYYVVAVEANGNLTLAHRVDGRLLLFAQDHAFEGVTEVPGAPPYSLLTIDAVPDLITWIEVCAAAWRRG